MDNNLKEGMLLDGRYRLLRPLSSAGGTADVWLALDTNTIDEVYDDEKDELVAEEASGIKVAIKIYRPKNALDIGEQRFREEFKIVFNCHHANLIQPINFSIYEGTPYLVLPYCANGSSEQLQGELTDKKQLWRYIADVSAGLAYLHAFNPTIVHHDIKPANVLVDDNGDYAITDFGISSHRGFNREGYDDSNSGTMAYMAPERFKDGYESVPDSDIWSFGATLYELVTGKVPFGENGGLGQSETGKECPKLDAGLPRDIRRLIADCLSLDPDRRPSAAEINKAACIGRYPVRPSGLFYAVTAAIAVALIVLAVVLLPFRKEEKPLTHEEAFDQALAMMNSGDSATLARGLAMMDSLGSLDYVPALYESAFTYGWNSDSTYLSRKRILGIEYYPEASTDNEYMPKSDKVNTKAFSLLGKIVELGDSRYPAYNAEALYRLAMYYSNGDKEHRQFLPRNIAKAMELLRKAREWAVKDNNEVLVNKLDMGLAALRKLD